MKGSCRASALVFVSSTVSDAALGGPRGADATCADLAEAAGLGGYWFSWTSDTCTSPLQRFEKLALPYRMLDGTQIASSWTRLVNRPPNEFYLEAAFDVDEAGQIPRRTDRDQACPSPQTNVPPGCYVWTNTRVDGRVDALANNNGCLGLTSNDSADAPSSVGQLTFPGSSWTEGNFKTCGLNQGRIFCFEQSEENPDPLVH